MRVFKIHFYLSMLLVLLPIAAIAENVLDKIELPAIRVMPGMSTAWAAEKMIYNGTPMSIRKFRTRKTVDDVLRFYDSEWKSKMLAVITRNRIGDERIIGYGKGDYYYSVQVKNAGNGAEGSMVVTSSRYVEKKSEFPVMPGAKIMTHIQNLDRGIHAETITLSTVRTISSASSWYDAELTRNGWKRQHLDKKDSYTMLLNEYQKGKQQCQIRSIKAKNLPNIDTVVQIIWIKG